MNSIELFQHGYNCSQSVFVPFARKFFPNDTIALKMMSPFGGGIAHSDNICGAVSGGIAAIGLQLGNAEADDIESKNKCSEATRKFLAEFKNKHGNTACTTLIGYNLSISGEKEKANETGVFDTKCTTFVEDASKLVEQIISEYK